MSFLFNSLDNRDLGTVINAMEEINFNSGDTISLNDDIVIE